MLMVIQSETVLKGEYTMDHVLGSFNSGVEFILQSITTRHLVGGYSLPGSAS